MNSLNRISRLLLKFPARFAKTIHYSDTYKLLEFCRVYKQDKSNKPQLIEHIKTIEQGSILTMNHYDAMLLSFALTDLLDSDHNVSLLLSRLEELISKMFRQFPVKTQENIIINYYRASKKGYRMTNKNFAESILFAAKRQLESGYLQARIIFDISRFYSEFKDLGVNCDPFFDNVKKTYIQQEYLKTQKLKDIYFLLSSFLSFQYSSRDENSYDKSIYFEAMEPIKCILSSTQYKINEIYDMIKVYITMDEGTEDFRRFLENIMFSNLGALHDSLVVNLPFIYQERIVYDYAYLMRSIWKPLYEELISRFHTLSPVNLQLMIFRMWWSSSSYGHYTDDRIIKEFQLLISDPNRLEKLGNAKSEILINIIGYMLQSGYFHRADILIPVNNQIPVESLPDPLLSRLAAFNSRIPLASPEFWESFTQRLPILLTQRVSFPYIFSTSLNLRLKNHPSSPQVDLIIGKKLEIIESEWYSSRKSSIAKKKTPYLHSIVEQVLTDEGIEYEKEYYDKYFIDIVILDRKLAIEICGPNHYVFPNNRLNGRTLTKSQNLEALGWKVCLIDFFSIRHTNYHDQIMNIISGSTPLQY